MTETSTLSGDTNVELKKKGRKPKQANYFDVREEQAVIRYLNAQTFDEKNKIYNEFLRKPLDKMISSIIRRYKLYRKDMDFYEIHIDTHSFLMTKIDKFKPAKEKKAYSYFGTICKNYLMGQIIKDQKDMNRKISYEDISSNLENNTDFSYSIDREVFDSELVIKNFLGEINDFISQDGLSENEIKLGQALYDLFENYDNIFIGTDNNKFNKNIILLSLREMTNLSTKEIRSSMKKYKTIYFDLIQKMIK
jgi:predicted SprT family Zn-dependent metalloprotease